MIDYIIYHSCTMLFTETDFSVSFCMSSTLQFWKPGTLGPGSSLDRTSGEEDGFLPSVVPPQAQSIRAQRDRLPIAKHS